MSKECNCSYCGAKITITDKNCPECGGENDLYVDQQQIKDVNKDSDNVDHTKQVSVNTSSNIPKSKKKGIFVCWIILFVVLFTTVGAGVYYFFSQKNKLDPKPIEESELPVFEIQPLKIEYVFEDDLDEDNDGLLNKEERSLGTDLSSFDSDNDYLLDYEEVKVYGTDPLNSDTDGDGLFDGVEIAAGLDPLKQKTDDETLDIDRKFEKTYTVNNATLNVSGDANISEIYMGVLDTCNMTNVPGVISDVYELYMDNMHFDAASLTLPVDLKKVTASKSSKENIAVYQFMNDGTFKKVGGVLNEDDSTITVNLEHFSKYVVGLDNIIGVADKANVFILLDDSGSMYSLTGDLSNISEEKLKEYNQDPDFKRVDLMQSLVKEANEHIKYSLASFTKNFMLKVDGFTSDTDLLINKLEEIRTAEEHNWNGTYIANSIKSALNQFEDGDISSRKFIILLTDGETTEGGWLDFSLYDEDDAIEDAQKKNVSIIVIGLGDNVDSEYLMKIASNTGGSYIHASDANALESVKNLLLSELNFNYVDLDNDGVNDHILVADSGFDVLKDGFCFNNYNFIPNKDKYEIINGQCFGLALAAQSYYSNSLPLKVDYLSYPNSLVHKNFKADAADISSIEYLSENSVNGISNCKNDLYGLKIFGDSKSNKRVVVSDCYTYPDDLLKIVEESKVLYLETDYLDGEHILNYDGETHIINSVDYIYRTTRNVDYDMLSDEDKERYDFLQYIYNLYSSQFKSDWYTDYSIDCLGDNSDTDLSNVIKMLNSGRILIAHGEGHAVNLIKIYRSIEDPNEFIFVLYDNNYPGVEKTITLKRRKADVLTIDWIQGNYIYDTYDTDNVFLKNGKSIYVNYTYFNYYCE